MTTRLPETRDWYVDLLGLTLVEQWDEPGDKGCILGVSRVSGQALLEICEASSKPDYGGLSLQFEVTDLDPFIALDDGRFRWDGPVDRPWGSRYLRLSDPNGICVILFAAIGF